MDVNKKLPVWALIILDILLVAAIILPFAYFHHVRDMWFSEDEKGQRGYEGTEMTVPTTQDVFLTVEPTGDPTTGDPATQTSYTDPEPVILSGDAAVRSYLEQNGIPTPRGIDGSSCDRIYRSADICVVQYSAVEQMDGFRAKYYLFDVYVKSVKNFYTVNSKQKSMHELIAEGESAAGGKVVTAVNGDYSSNKNHCRVVVRNGVLFRSPEVIDSDVCVMYYDGSIETYTADEFDFEAVEARSPYQIWDFGPELLDKDGKAKSEFDDEAYDRHILKNTHPRTALGYYEPGHYCLLVVDGRQDGEDGEYLYGCSVRSLAKFCERIGCARAYNMDGGDSSQAYMNGVDVRIDGTRETQRVLSDIICVGEIAPEVTPDPKEQTAQGGENA